MAVHTFRLLGVSPILQNNPIKTLVPDDGSKVNTKKVYIPEQEAEDRIYRNQDGQLYHPAIAIRSAIMKAGAYRKIGKMTAPAAMSASFFPEELEGYLMDVTTREHKTTWEQHSCRAVVNKAGILRVRPLIRNWFIDLPVDIDEDLIPNVSVVVELLNIAGKIVGIGDWRPEKKGMFGRFKAEVLAPKHQSNGKVNRIGKKVKAGA